MARETYTFGMWQMKKKSSKQSRSYHLIPDNTCLFSLIKLGFILAMESSHLRWG